MARLVVVLRSVVRGFVVLVEKRPRTRQERAEWLHRLCERVLRKLEIQVDAVGSFPDHGAMISNHLSYLDIFVLASLRRCVFVSKAEVESWPLIGWVTTMVGTVYVARGHGGSAIKAREGMRDALDAGLPVVFFPEGTTSNGSGLLKFHSGLLAQVLAEGAPVSAALIHYSLAEDNGADVTAGNDVCYWGDRNMWAHIFKLLGLRGLRAEVRFAGEPIGFAPGAAADRKRAALEARAAVAALGGRMDEGDGSCRSGGTESCTISDSTNVHLP